MRRYKIDFKKGSATFLFGCFMMLLCLIIVLVLVEQHLVYNNSETVQMAADSVADGTAVYASSLYLYDEPTQKQKIRERVSELEDLIQTHAGITIDSLELDETELEDQRISVRLNAKFNGVTGVQNFNEQNTRDFSYTLSRKAVTSYNMMGMGDQYLWPISTRHLSDRFTIRDLSDPAYEGTGATPFHCAIDLPASLGQPFYCVADGVVESISLTGVHSIVIRHGETQYGETLYTRYVHGDAAGITVGQTVHAGQQIGTANNHGTRGVHLDFGCYTVNSSGQRIYHNVLKTLYHLEFDGVNDGRMTVNLKTVNDMPINTLTFWKEESSFTYSHATNVNGSFTSGTMY